MVPEISLTPQLENRFKERFGLEIKIWHSKITPKRRKEIWHKCYEGEPLVVETEGHSNIKVGDTVKVGFPSNRCHLFDSSDQAFE